MIKLFFLITVCSTKKFKHIFQSYPFRSATQSISEEDCEPFYSAVQTHTVSTVSVESPDPTASITMKMLAQRFMGSKGILGEIVASP